MVQPFMVKPCPNMYLYTYLYYNLNLENSISFAVAGYPKVNLFVTIPTKELSLSLLNSYQPTKPTFYVIAKKVKFSLFVTTPTKSS